MAASRPQPLQTRPPKSAPWRRRSLLCGAACLLWWQLVNRSAEEAFVATPQAKGRRSGDSCVCRRAAEEDAAPAVTSKEDPFERLQKALGKDKAKPSPVAAKAPPSPEDCEECEPEYSEEDMED